MVSIKKIEKKEKLESSNISYDDYYGKDSTRITQVTIENASPSDECDSIMPLLFDKEGKILEIEVIRKPSYWKINEKLTLPKNAEKGTVFIEQEENEPLNGSEGYYTNKHGDFLYIQIEKEKPIKSIEIAANIILDVTDKHKLSGIWILNLPRSISYDLSSR